MSSVQVLEGQDCGLSAETIYHASDIKLGSSSRLCYFPERILADPRAQYEAGWIGARDRTKVVVHLTPLRRVYADGGAEEYCEARTRQVNLFLVAEDFELAVGYWENIGLDTWRLTPIGIRHYGLALARGKLVLHRAV